MKPKRELPSQTQRFEWSLTCISRLFMCQEELVMWKNASFVAPVLNVDAGEEE